jgi:hypothetical protein
LLRFADGVFHHACVETFGYLHRQMLRLQFQRVAVRSIIGAGGAAEIDGIAVETRYYSSRHRNSFFEHE